jgi:uncharacterized peroxidase-related enzyme
MTTTHYRLHTAETAPAEARDLIEGAARAYGFVPNLLAVMAEAPTLLKGYWTLSRLFEESSLSATERQVVLLAVSAENTCAYCTAAHRVIAGMQQVPRDVVDAVVSRHAIDDAKLEALRQFTASVVVTRGQPTQEATAAFLAAGYGRQQVLEVVLGVGIKTLSNYTNHMAHTPIDQAFAAAATATTA